MRHNSLSQPKGHIRPLHLLMASFRLGSATMNAAGTPSTSAIPIKFSFTRNFRCLPRCSNSFRVKGTKPQLFDQASLKRLRMVFRSS